MSGIALGLPAEAQYAALAGTAAACWLVIIAALHVIKPELKPSTRLISEYARPPKGWIMQVAFYCAAVSCFALVLAAWSAVSCAGLILLTITGLGFAGAGLFVTDPVVLGADTLTVSGRLHAVFAFITMILFPIMATVFDISAGGSPAWPTIHAWLPALSILTWAGLASFVFVLVYAARHENAPVGYAERFLVLTFTVWLLVVSFAMVWR